MEHLMRSVQAGRIVHALLFTGPRGTGKHTAANLFAQAIFCTGADRPCGACPACRRVLAGVHPDLHRVVPDEKNAIRVDAIRDLVDELSMRPYEGGYHVAIIDRADRMNANAQNALLKTLENPVGDVMFFFDYRYAGRAASDGRVPLPDGADAVFGSGDVRTGTGFARLGGRTRENAERAFAGLGRARAGAE